MRRVLGLVSLVLAALSAQPAAAEWKRAESDHFIVYSDGREGTLREYVRKLEVFDTALRSLIPLQHGATRKLPIYLVDGPQEMRQSHPYLGRTVGGFYMASAEDIYAVAIRNEDEDILRHEYVHHFMLQNFAAAYPAWLVEGFAEYYAATEIEDGSVLIGGANPWRVQVLARYGWISIEDLLTLRGDQVRGADRYTYYPVAWLLTHWFLGNPDRSRQLQAYLDAVGQGVGGVEAMTAATGLTPREIERELRRYFTGQVPQLRLTRDFGDPQITVTTLGRSANDLLLINQRLRIATPEEDRAELVAEVRRRAARHGDDPLALLALGHAELHFGDADAGAALLTRLLEREPAQVEALQLMATHHLRLAREATDDRVAQTNLAIGYLGRAYAADPENYYTFMLLGQAREGAPEYPTANDLLTWQSAFELAPQLANTRLGYARALMQADRHADAAILLPPLANAPHGGAAADAARLLLTQARTGQAPLSQEEIDAASERQAKDDSTALPQTEPDEDVAEGDPEPEPEAPEPDAPEPDVPEPDVPAPTPPSA